MKLRRHGDGYHFFGDTQSGITMRWGHTLAENPVRAPWPELADISISNHCTKGCPFCYKNSTDNHVFMSPAEYAAVLKHLQSDRWGNVFQVALGGGEPLEHPQFEQILQITQRADVVANFTTNGLHLDNAVARMLSGRVGSVALSVGTALEIDPQKIRLLVDAGVHVNLHFVLSDSSLDDAIALLNGRYNDLLLGIDSVIFLTYKPAGRAADSDCLHANNRLLAFASLVDKNDCCARIGFDACFVPFLMRHTDVNTDFIDPCECGFFSVYVDEHMQVKPCSFCNEDRYCFSLHEHTMQEIWENLFEPYRQEVCSNICQSTCKNLQNCRGKCLFYEQLALCFTPACINQTPQTGITVD
ncbi:radical SAM protein [Ethanoligenens sp.]|uniref:radical SAM protein n=1 Tax=Ethanoligenens sp. TaxID=2099655 RepID=UPI0039E7F2EA